MVVVRECVRALFAGARDVRPGRHERRSGQGGCHLRLRRRHR